MSAQQVVRQIEAAQNIKEGARNAHRRNRMMIDRHVMIVPELRLTRRNFLRELIYKEVQPHRSTVET